MWITSSNSSQPLRKREITSWLRNNHSELNKATLVRWTDKTLNQSLFKQDIKGNNYLAIKSNGKTEPNDVYITSKNISNSNEEIKNSNGVKNDNQDGVLTKLMNMAITIEHLEGDDHLNDLNQQWLKYFVEQPMNQATTSKQPQYMEPLN